jgi:mono/diheme cytochrome c family protein
VTRVIRRTSASFLAGLLLGLLNAEHPAAHDPITTKVTFAREIRGILATHCVTCHRAGGSAPMPLTTYEETRPWARAIKEQILTRRMPKWHAARGFGAFANDPTLTPFEMALVSAWVDGGLPRGPDVPVARVTSRVTPTPATDEADVMTLVVPSGGTYATKHVETAWITAWDFQPGDPLITAAVFTQAGGALLGNWVAGDVPVRFPADAAVPIASEIRVQLVRRRAADFEHDYKPRPSVLRLISRATPPSRLIWTEHIACGATRRAIAAQILAVRPLLAAGASARVAIQRLAGAPPVLVGWFRDFDSAYARTYWLARPIDQAVSARVVSDAPCDVELVLARRQP